MNNITLIGRLTSDPKLTVANGISLTKYTLAVSRMAKDEVDFINCTAFNKNAEFAQKNFAKGQQIGVVGSLVTSSYEKDGVKQNTFGVNVSSQYFAGDKKKQETDENTHN